MYTNLEMAKAIIEDNRYTPEAFLEKMCDDTVNLHFDKVLFDAATIGGFEPAASMLEPTAVTGNIELPSGKTEISNLSAKGRRALVAFLRERLEADEVKVEETATYENLLPSNKAIRTWVAGSHVPDLDHAMRICFALGLDFEQSEVFCRSGNVDPKAFYPHSAPDTAYKICLASGLDYATARRIIRTYSEQVAGLPPVDGEAAGELEPTVQIVRELERSFPDERWDEDRALAYLLDHRGLFDTASRSIWNVYARCRAHLTFDLIAERHWPEGSPEATKEWLKIVRPSLKRCGLSTVDALRSKLDAVLEDADSDDARDELDEAWRAFTEDFETCSCPYELVLGYRGDGSSNRSKSTPLKANALVNETFVDMGDEDGIPRKRRRGRQTRDVAERASKSSLPWKGAKRKQRTFFEAYPTPHKVRTLDDWKARGGGVPLHEARKAIMLFTFAHYDRLMAKGDAERAYGYEDFVDTTNEMLYECGLAPLDPTDPCDMLVMHSVYTADPLNGGNRRPMDFYRTTVWESFNPHVEGDA